MIRKLNLRVQPKEKARSEDFNRVTLKIDEIIDSMGGAKSYYAECLSREDAEVKVVNIDDFVVDGNYPVHGTLLSVLFLNGNAIEGMSIVINSYTYPSTVWYGNSHISGDAVEAGRIVTMVFDRTRTIWRVISGVTKPLPALYVDAAYNLKFLLAGKYDNDMLEKLYNEIVGQQGEEVFRGNQILMMYSKTYVPVTLVEEKSAYTFEFLYGSKHYEFCMHRLGSGELEVVITDSGSNIITHWEE